MGHTVCISPGRIVGLASLVVLLLAAGAAAEPTDVRRGPLRVESSTDEAVRFSLRDLEPRWVERRLPALGEPLYDVLLPGFGNAGVPGGYRTPRVGGWLVVPPGTTARLRTVSEDWSPGDGRPLAVEPVPVLLPGDRPGRAQVSEIVVLPGAELPEGVDVPEGVREAFAERSRASGATVELGAISWWRGHRVVPVTVNAVRHDEAGRVSGVLRGGAWEVVFTADKAATDAAVPGAHAQRFSTRNDERFGDAFLNGDRLGSLSTEAAWRGLEAPARSGLKAALGAATLDGTEARLAVTRTGPVRVTYSRLRERGLIPDGPIAEDQLRLYQRRYIGTSGTGGYEEIEVPIHVVGEGDDFDGDDFFVFYGLRLRDDTAYQTDLGAGTVTVPGAGDPFEMNNDANLYWLACGDPAPGESWSRMATTTLPAAAGEPLAKYRRRDWIEEQGAFREHNPDNESDRMFYNWHLDTVASADISPLWAPDPTGDPVDMMLGFGGFDENDHAVTLDLVVDNTNVYPLGDHTVTVRVQSTTTRQVPASVLNGTNAQLRITGQGPNDWMFCYFNWLRIDYDALYRATNDRVTFHLGDGGGDRPVEVTGFTNDDLGLLDVTDPRQPRFVQLAGANVVDAGGSTTLSIMPAQTAGERRSYHATASFGSAGIPEFYYPLSSRSEAAEDPTQAGGTPPDLVVVTHADFRQAADRWVQHRINRADGDLSVKVVDVQDLFDWYSGGLSDAWAIKRFCNQAVSQWGSWALMIIGDANENARGKRVLSQAQGWSTDWVPTHYHVQQALNYAPELMATDKWYVSLQAGTTYGVEDFPDVVNTPFDMLSGRLPCNSVAELDIMIDKIVHVETPLAGQDWRRRGLFIADDEWSNGYDTDTSFDLTYKFSETAFGDSERDSLAAMWNARSGVGLEPDLVLLKDILDPLIEPDPANPNIRDMSDTRRITAAAATPELLGALSRGGLVAHYQGHANPYVLSSEFWLEDRRTSGGRHDVDLIENGGKPWFFMGMGCHIADWAQDPVRSATVSNERSLSEKFLLIANGGAYATYASSGYEFITANRIFGEYIFRRWIDQPPGSSHASPMPDGGGSRWVLGELMWAAEADFMAQIGVGYPYGEMLTQYVILGDPLMRLDAGEPLVTATLVGATDLPVTGEAELVALDETNVRTLRIEALDEAGIDRLEVLDEQGLPLTSATVTATRPAGALTDKRVDYEVTVPIEPYDHDVLLRLYDTGAPLPGDRHWELVLSQPQTSSLFAGGQEIDPETFAFEPGVPVIMSAAVTSPAWLDGGEVFALTSETLTLSGIAFNVDKARGLTVDFTAEAPDAGDDQGHAVVLSIDGHTTEMVLQAGAGGPVAGGIGRVFNYPNPMVADTRFVFESGFDGGRGTIRVFSVSGRPVARVPFEHQGAETVVTWDGRDAYGDELGNGTYLYRIEVETTGGTQTSDMQRLVIMR